MVEVHAAEALLIVDGHSHLLAKDDRCQMRQRRVDSPGRITVVVSKDAWIRCKIPKEGVSGPAEAILQEKLGERVDQFRLDGWDQRSLCACR